VIARYTKVRSPGRYPLKDVTQKSAIAQNRKII
jgi:hypothetical protein